MFCNHRHKLLTIVAVTPHFSYVWAAPQDLMAVTGDNECAYCGKYDPLKTIFELLSFGCVHENKEKANFGMMTAL